MTSESSQGNVRIRVTVPVAVAEFYEEQAKRYGSSASACAAPVVCAYAYGEIKQDFTQQPGADLRPK